MLAQNIVIVQCKIDAIATYGGKIIQCEPTMDAREEVCHRIQQETGSTFVPPYNDPFVISGQVCQDEQAAHSLIVCKICSRRVGEALAMAIM